MKIFLDPNINIDTEQGQQLPDLLVQLGYHVVDFDQRTNKEEYDLMLLDGQFSNIDTGYLAAMALSREKTILCLIPKGFPIPEIFEQLVAVKSYSKLFKPIFYTSGDIDSVLKKVLLDCIPVNKEKASIKFTLRITPTMEKFIESKSKELALSKADYLRNLIQDQMPKR